MGESRSEGAAAIAAPAASRGLDDDERAYVAHARATAFALYEGVRVPHRSCGIALAETFGVPSRPYQALRRGGLTGTGTCGAVRAGEQLLGELLGDPDPGGAVTPALRAAVIWYQEQVGTRVDRGDGAERAPDLVCNSLVRRHGEFTGRARAAYCTNLAAELAALTAEALVRFGAGVRPAIPVVPDRPEDNR